MSLPFDAVADVVCTFRDSGNLIYNVIAEQVAGTTDQLRVQFNYPATLTTGTFYVRFKSNYDPLLGKAEIAALGGFPLSDTVQSLAGAGQCTMVSGNGLTAGTEYTAVIYWVEDGYTGNHALGDVGEVWPTFNDLVASNPVTILNTVSPPTDIFGTLSVPEGAAAGTAIGSVTANQPNCTFSKVGTTPDWVDVAPNGQVSVASGQSAPSSSGSPYSLTVRADNSSQIGGGALDKTLPVAATVSPGTGTSQKAIPIPAINTNGGIAFPTVAALQTALSALAGSWSQTMSGWGLPASGVEPVLGLASGQHGNLSLSGFDYSLLERVTIRGEGPFTRTAWLPEAGTKVGTLSIGNCRNMRLMGLEAESPGASHTVTNCVDTSLVRCVIMGDVARSASEAAVFPAAGASYMLVPNNTTDCGIIQCALLGSRKRTVGGDFVTNSRLSVIGCVFDQTGTDCIQIKGGVNDDWEVHDNLFCGRFRNPTSGHSDAVQIFNDSGSAQAKRWHVTGNVVLTMGWWGTDNYVANQGFYWGSGSLASDATFLDNAFCVSNGAVKGSHGTATARFNGQWMPIDPTNAEQGGVYHAGLGGISAGNADENIVCQRSASQDKGAGPNGFNMLVPNSNGSDQAGADWGAMIATLEFGDQATLHPSRWDGIERLKPKVGTRAHWTHAARTGPFQLLRRLFDPGAHEHHKDWGWPVAPMTHIAYDPGNALANASGTYQNFSADGGYLG